MRRLAWAGTALAGVIGLAGCSDPQSRPHAAAGPPPPPSSAPALALGPPAASAPAASAAPADPVGDLAAAAPTVTPSTSPAGQAIDAAAPGAKLNVQQTRDLLIRAEVLLDRAHLSPGVIDGRSGSNFNKALGAYEQAHGLPADGVLGDAAWQALTKADVQPAVTDYVITEDDVKGPFVSPLPTDMKAMSALKSLAYAGPLELLAEKFHMDQALLTALNPGADFTRAGTSIVVAAVGPDPLPVEVTRIEVDKSLGQLRAYGADGALAAAFPATVGSTERPAPVGELKVVSVVKDPNYSYDPKRLTFGKRKDGPLVIAPGPNNPVGAVWIALNQETYGIHGAPDPTLVGKTASHGCVRLTNWDARALGAALKKGAAVDFVGAETKKKTA